MSDEQIDIFAPEPCHIEPARERVALDPVGEFIAARRADDRRARQRFNATLNASPPHARVYARSATLNPAPIPAALLQLLNRRFQPFLEYRRDGYAENRGAFARH